MNDGDDDFDWQVFRRHRRKRKSTATHSPKSPRRVRRVEPKLKYVTRDQAAVIIGLSSFLLGRLAELDASYPKFARIEAGKKFWLKSDIERYRKKRDEGWDYKTQTYRLRYLIDE